MNEPDHLQAISQIIRSRLKAANQRFHANDNIAHFIHTDELAKLESEVVEKIQALLDSLVIDTQSDHNTQETAKRLARMYLHEVFSGRYQVEPDVTKFPNINRLNELLIVGPITVRSACSHHFCPIMGKLWIGVMPNEKSALIGLSKYVRLAHWIMQRPQIQEEAVIQLADLIEKRMHLDGLAVVMEAEHFCMHWRGVKDNQASMINSVMRGCFLSNTPLRQEFLSIMKKT